MFRSPINLPKKLLKLSDTSCAVSTFNDAYSIAFKVAKDNNKKEFGMDEIAPELEKLLSPILMEVDLTNKDIYEQLSHWTKHYTWQEEKILTPEAQDIFSKCIAIQGMVACLLPIIKADQEKQKIVGKITPISKNSPDFRSVVSFHKKISGANPGMHVTIFKKNGITQTYTIKQGKTIGNTLAECFTSHVMRKIIGIEPAILTSEKKTEDTLPHQKIIAPAHLVLRNCELKSKDPDDYCKTMWVASEWSRDQLSFDACKLFGYEKRMYFAGTLQSELFIDLQKLNHQCDLGLELVVIAATYSCDFDLHLENFRLNFNSSECLNENASRIKELFVEFEELIRLRQHQIKSPILNLDVKDNASLKRTHSGKHLSNLIEVILKLKKLGVKVYFHKIDHDSGFFRYSDERRKVSFSSHQTSPVYFKSLFLVRTQPTLHITELTGTTGEGLDKLLLSDKAIEILRANPYHVFIETVLDALEELFKDIVRATRELSGLSPRQKKVIEVCYLIKFYEHVTGKRFPDAGDFLHSSLDCTSLYIGPHIYKLKRIISNELRLGSLLKVNDLQGQLFQRLSKNDSKEMRSRKHIAFKYFLREQLKLNQAYYFFLQWPEIISDYRIARPNVLHIFSSIQSDQTSQLILHMENKYRFYRKHLLYQRKFSSQLNFLLANYSVMQNYLSKNINGKKGSRRRLGRLILDYMKPFCYIPLINDSEKNNILNTGKNHRICSLTSQRMVAQDNANHELGNRRSCLSW